jgi:hypothetical protein
MITAEEQKTGIGRAEIEIEATGLEAAVGNTPLLRLRRRFSPAGLAPSAAVPSPATRAGPGGGEVGMGIVSPIRGLRTSAFSAASAEARPSRIGSGNSTSLRSPSALRLSSGSSESYPPVADPDPLPRRR